jgi:hypothetical protein
MRQEVLLGILIKEGRSQSGAGVSCKLVEAKCGMSRPSTTLVLGIGRKYNEQHGSAGGGCLNAKGWGRL